MTTYQQSLDLLGRAYPALWSTLYPRAYRDAGEWHSAKIPAAMLGAGVAAACSAPWDAQAPSYRQLYLAAARCAAHAMPTYYVSRQLLEAVARTDPPPDLLWPELPLPHPGLSLILPRGTLRHPTEGEIGAIVLARVSALEPIGMDLTGAPTRRLDQDVLIAAACAHEHPSMPIYDCTLNAATSPRLDDLPEVTAGTHTRADGRREPMVADDTRAAQSILSLALRLVLVMSARPELIEPGQLTGVQRTARTGPPLEYWTPTIVGRAYRTPVEQAEPIGSHASPRLHWRRGHYAQQAHGPGWSLRRLVWREPVLVGNVST